jgi:hypothetical protein
MAAPSRVDVRGQAPSPILTATPPEVATPSRKVSAAVAAARTAPRGRLLWIALIGLPLAIINIVGLPYYLEPLGQRVRHPWHAWLRPSGYVGQSAGILAFLIFLVLWLYPLRKKYRALAFMGTLGGWMNVHVASALALPLLLVIHSSWRADGLIGLGLMSMFVVIASGVVGRYLYTRIPRARSGVELTREEVAAKRRELITLLAATTGLSEAVVDRTLDVSEGRAGRENLLQIFWHLISNDLLRWKRTRELRRRWAAVAPAGRPLSSRALADAVELAGQEMKLAQQSQMLEATQRVFRFWHVAHRPFAVTALIAVIIHVVVVVAVGATWLLGARHG